uniref:Uncharacterized protein n=1 Tax=Opuntia streptacantha TaxID=393608 RepID=A0A7C9CQG2_OPUST
MCGTPNSPAASTVKDMVVSDTMQLTGGTSPPALLRRQRSSLKGCSEWRSVETQSSGMSCVASASTGGRPSVMVSNRKEGRPSRAAGPRDRRRRLWLYSLLTKVMWKPLEWRILASLSMGFM